MPSAISSSSKAWLPASVQPAWRARFALPRTGSRPKSIGRTRPLMSNERNDEQQMILASLRRRSAAGQIDRRGFLTLATAAGIGAVFGARALPQGKPSIAASYDYIVVGAGSGGCTVAARLSEDPARRVL